MFAKSSNSFEEEIDGAIFKNYMLNSKNLDMVVVSIDGRYPSAGSRANMKNTFGCYVLKGTGEVTIKGKTFEIKKEDVFIIEPKKEFHIVGKQLKLLMSCTPAYSESHSVSVIIKNKKEKKWNTIQSQ